MTRDEEYSLASMCPMNLTDCAMKGRRGTKAQRQAIARMTDRGYALPKDVLANFSRVNNRTERTSEAEGSVTMEELNSWRRNWLNQAFGVIERDTMKEPIQPAHHPFGDDIPCNEKYRMEFESMFGYTNPLDHEIYDEIWLEIGFGSGDNMIANARLNPSNLVIGAEIHQPGRCGCGLRTLSNSNLRMPKPATSRHRKSTWTVRRKRGGR